MAAKAAMIGILSDYQLTRGEMFTAALASAREHHMGLTPLAKLLEETADVSRPTSVEHAVSQLVEFAFGMSKAKKAAEAAIAGARPVHDIETDLIEPFSPQTFRPDMEPEPEVSIDRGRPDFDLELPPHSPTPVVRTSPSTHTVSTQTPIDMLLVPASFLNKLMTKISTLTDLVISMDENNKTQRIRLKDTQAEIANVEKRLQTKIEELTDLVKSTEQQRKMQHIHLTDAQTEARDENRRMHSRIDELSEGTIQLAKHLNDTQERCNQNNSSIKQQNSSTSSTTPGKIEMTHLESTNPPPESVQHGNATDESDLQPWLSAVKRASSLQSKNRYPPKVLPPTKNPKNPKEPLGKLVGAPRIKKAIFYVGGISEDCTPTDLRDFCQTHCPLLECRFMPSNRCGTQSAYIAVPDTCASKFEAINWPNHLYSRPWIFGDDWRGRNSTQPRSSDENPLAHREAIH